MGNRVRSRAFAPGDERAATHAARSRSARPVALWAALAVWFGVAGLCASLGADARARTGLDATWHALFALVGVALASSIALVLFLHRAERRASAAARALGASEDRSRRFFQRTQAPMLVLDPEDGRVVEANSAASEFYGCTPQRLRETTLFSLATDSPEETRQRLVQCRDAYARFETVHRHADGRLSHVEMYAGPARVGGRRLLFGIVHDVTEVRRLAERLRAAEKMEALGRMAGGVANDINNLLTVVLGHAQIAKASLGPGDPVESALEEIERSVERGAAFTTTLLALGRSRSVERVPVDLATAVRDAEPSLRRFLPEGMTLELDLTAAPVGVLVEPAQFREALCELVENAAEAIRGTGTILVSALAADDLHAVSEGADAAGPGPWAIVRVTDTGPGILPEIRSHLFEPFFTTKPSGGGRGLGLAAVWGIARQNGGTVTVDPGTGTGATFTLWLPRADDPDARPHTGEHLPLARPNGTRRRRVLLAEDDPQLRRLFAGVLVSNGWDVVAVTDGTEALDRWHLASGDFDVLVTDVALPRLGGSRLAELLVAERPRLPVVFVTGWSDDAPPPGPDGAARPLLRKPFRPSLLARTVERVAGPARPRLAGIRAGGA